MKFSPAFWQKPTSIEPKKSGLNPNYTALKVTFRGKPKGEIAEEFEAIGLTADMTVAIKPEVGTGGRVTLTTLGEVGDDMVYVGRLAKNFGAGPKGTMHAFQDPNP